MKQRRMGSKYGVYLDAIECEDGDMFISVGQIGGSEQTVDFASEIAGGGCSPRTYKALQKLLQAMAEDNKDESLPSLFVGRFR